MSQVTDYSLPDAYKFLEENGLGRECEEIKTSSDSFRSYTSTLRRAKVIVLIRDKGLLAKFRDSIWEYGHTDRGKTRIKFYENLIERFNADEEGISTEEEVEIIAEENEFAYENDLRNYLIRNLSAIEKRLRLYESPDGKTGEEFYLPGTARRIDILAVDADNNFVVIELKVSRGYEKVVGQTLYYQSMIKTHFEQSKVRAIIIAREISPELKAATQFLTDFELFEYQLSLTLSRV